MVEETHWSDSDEDFRSRLLRNFSSDVEDWRKNISDTNSYVRESVKKEIVEVFSRRQRKLGFIRCSDQIYSRVKTVHRHETLVLPWQDEVNLAIQTVAGKKLLQECKKCSECNIAEQTKFTSDAQHLDFPDLAHCVVDWWHVPAFEVAKYVQESGWGIGSIITYTDLSTYIITRSLHDDSLRWFSWEAGSLFSTETLLGDNFACSMVVENIDSSPQKVKVWINMRCWIKDGHRIFHDWLPVMLISRDMFHKCLTNCANVSKDRLISRLECMCVDKLKEEQRQSVQEYHKPIAGLISEWERAHDVFRFWLKPASDLRYDLTGVLNLSPQTSGPVYSEEPPLDAYYFHSDNE